MRNNDNWGKYLRTQGILFLCGPRPGPNKPIGSGDPSQDINGHPDGVIRHVIGEGISGGSDADAAAAAGGEVKVVQAGARADHALDGGVSVEIVGGDGRGPQAQHEARRLREGRERWVAWVLVRVKHSVYGAEARDE